MPQSRIPRKPAVAGWLLSALALVLLATAGWIRYRFGAIAFEQFVLHIPLTGGAGDDSLVVEAVVVCLLLPLGLVGAAIRFRRRRGRQLNRRRQVGLASVALVAALGVLLAVVGLPRYAVAQVAGRSFARYYVTPELGAAPERPLNLITIYLESMENTYGDESLFGDNLLAGLDEATEGWARYDTLMQYPEGGWTMSGIVSTQCGIPLKSRLLVEGIDPNDFGEKADSYLAGATCLGDLLAQAGYRNAYVGGANTRFAGKDTYLTQHGYDMIRGREQWEPEEDPAEISTWGLSDHQMFAHAADTLDELRETGELYHLTLLTLDTHEPAGEYPSCTSDEALRMARAITCSSRALAGFVEHLEQVGALEDTVVVVMGDHLKATAEGGFFAEELDGTEDRTIVLRIWSPEPVGFTRERADQFSVLATVLDVLGFAPPEGRAGLGVSFVGDHPRTGTALELAPGEYEPVMTSPSSGLYRTFWQEPAQPAVGEPEPTEPASEEPEPIEPASE